PTRAPLMIGVDTTLLTITVLVLIGRFYSRFSILKRVGNDDWCILAAAVGMFATIALHLLMIKYGGGRHVWDITMDQMSQQFTIGTVTRVLYLPTVACVRVSILLFMRRLSPHVAMQVGTAILIFVNIAVAVICACLLMFNCTPARSFWVFPPLRPPGRKCVGNDLAIEKAVPIVNALLDFVVWLVPVTMMWNVRFLGWKQKVLQIMLLGLGLVACIPSVLRLPNIDSMKKDMSWHGVALSLWTDVEIGVAIMAASVPALYPLFVMFMRQSF
ncbi:hypothetical protein K440DRAFT_520230, partial [Wilcoxina mikolae CBS 423.85]